MAATIRGIIPFLPAAAANKRAVSPSEFSSSKSSSVIKATRFCTNDATLDQLHLWVLIKDGFRSIPIASN
ncbi:hypothetical protein M8C21_032187 [Ambrosia artemisiifolia]|uniref:Uncharacterized protein n=1 Tax=Ambrosia artemisiifolia TaxID=4212 RepID=A0AAD5CHS2_AMBAR|nr:hypothetical protein M8C21_032187 [Ambrosia artemisiifolia]